ncbi:MAG TPA: plastocyanin/azurin family copper-binding protein [Candidatus Saccharimonadales bacterium]|nr:plastocyanin/azurin family copper-binding protein [Candidatus Saccharimonadales bacterium]
MKKKLTVLVVILIVIGGFYYIKHRGNKPPQQTNNVQVDPYAAKRKALDPKGYTNGASVGDFIEATDKKQVGIDIEDYVFVTTLLKIKKGTVVTWTNGGKYNYTIASDKASPKKGLASGLLAPGETYEYTFDKTGLYEYYSLEYPSLMKGVITVVDQ